MTRLWEVVASRTTSRTDAQGVTWTSVQQIPTFFLDANVQGILTAEKAEKIARDILTVDGSTVHLSAYPSQFLQ